MTRRRGWNSDINRKRMQKRKREFHRMMAREIFESPDILNVDGLALETVLFKERNLTCRYNGKTSRPDFLFCYLTNEGGNQGYNLLLLDFKVEESGIGSLRGYDQIDIGRNYMRRNWNRILLDHKSQLRYYMDGDVILHTGYAYKPPIDNMEVNLQSQYLGRIEWTGNWIDFCKYSASQQTH